MSFGSTPSSKHACKDLGVLIRSPGSASSSEHRIYFRSFLAIDSNEQKQCILQISFIFKTFVTTCIDLHRVQWLWIYTCQVDVKTMVALIKSNLIHVIGMYFNQVQWEGTWLSCIITNVLQRYWSSGIVLAYIFLLFSALRLETHTFAMSWVSMNYVEG